MTYGHPLAGGVPDGRVIAEVKVVVFTPVDGFVLVTVIVSVYLVVPTAKAGV
jgi:hypothetical protein